MRSIRTLSQGPECSLGYAIAAYAIAIGSVVAYGAWVMVQRRALTRQQSGEGARGASAGRADSGT